MTARSNVERRQMRHRGLVGNNADFSQVCDDTGVGRELGYECKTR
jgi:hypothetical protein